MSSFHYYSISSKKTMENRLNNSLRRDMAFAFWDDARDLRDIFNSLWSHRENYSKTGRIKIVLNLVMACECALKSHIILGNPNETPKSLLKKIKFAGHNIKNLAALSNYMSDRSNYNEIASLLSKIAVEVRYSLNATHTYFRTKDTYDFYENTIANARWVNDVISQLIILIDACQDVLTGPVELDWDVWFQTEEAFNELMKRPQKIVTPKYIAK
ncbi:hypothetical protein [Delftia acidovorans]